MSRTDVRAKSDALGATPAPSSGRRRMLILVASPLTEGVYRRIGARELATYFDVTVADCLQWVRRFDQRPEFKAAEAANIVRVDNPGGFSRLMQTLAPDFVLDFVGRGPHTKAFQVECRKVDALYITHHLVPVPTGFAMEASWRSLVASPRTIMARGLRYLRRRIANKQPYPPDVALLAGRKSANPWVLSARAVVQTATPGYFELQEARARWGAHGGGAEIGMPSGDYLLFIDDCLALSFDFRLGDFSPVIDARTYFELLNGFFTRLERLTGKPVVIAAHPDGREYPDYAAMFGGRRVYHGQTALLSCGCVCALTHYSSAVNYPVLLRKPVSVLTFDRLRDAPQGRVAEVIASALARPILDMAREEADSALVGRLLAPPQEAAYAAYERDYIVDTASPGANPFENLGRHLLQAPSARSASN